ncbi:MAG: heparinase II/III family protein [Ahrensia sp.]|nr:heparinase II/III family protein [Ahrensia sp.]
MGTAPDRVLFSPSCLRPSDPLIARDIYQGQFTFSGRTVEAGRASIFKAVPPSPAWDDDLHRFAWLRHLESAGTQLAADNARALIGDWITQNSARMRGTAWKPHICAARVTAWLQHSKFILLNSDHGFYRRFMSSLARQMRYLRIRAVGMENTIEHLHVRMALAFTSLALPTSAATISRAGAHLEKQLKIQILPDGGHISRNPDALTDILVNLLPLIQLYIAAAKPVPLELKRAVDRMFPRLRFFRHSDGRIAHFHGGGIGRSEIVAAVLRNDKTNGAVGEVAPQSGYRRLGAGDSVLIADMGKPVMGANGRANHASALSFEFSSNRSLIVINAGVDPLQRDFYKRPARASAAHSALVLDDQSSAHFQSFSWQQSSDVRLLCGPTNVEIQGWDTETGHGFLGRHNGYVKSLGLWHERGYLLGADGKSLSGYDRLTPESTRHSSVHKADIRFHLHPSVTVQAGSSDDTVQLTTDKGDIWLFSAVGAKPIVEESIYFAGVTGPVYTSQIVVQFSYPEIDSVQWRFDRLSA